MDIDFRLSRRCHTMQQHYIFMLMLNLYLFVCTFLQFVQRFDALQMCLSPAVKSAYFMFKRLQNLPFNEFSERLRCTFTLIEKFFTGK